MAINLSNDHKFQILKEAYIEQRKEISFWREHSWRVTIRMMTFILAVFGAAMFFNAKYPIVLIPLLALSIITTMYLHKNYKVYSERWKRLASIEEALGFFEQNVYIQGKPLHPPELKHPRVSYKGTAFFIAVIWIMAISTALTVIIDYI